MKNLIDIMKKGTSQNPVDSIRKSFHIYHYNDVIMGTMASQNNSLTVHYLIVYSGADQRKYQSSASPAFVRGIHPATRKCFHLMMLSWLIHRRFVLHGRRFTTFDAIPQSVSVIYLLKHVIAGKSSSAILQCHDTSAGELIMCNETHLHTSLADINMALS